MSKICSEILQKSLIDLLKKWLMANYSSYWNSLRKKDLTQFWNISWNMADKEIWRQISLINATLSMDKTQQRNEQKSL